MSAGGDKWKEITEDTMRLREVVQAHIRNTWKHRCPMCDGAHFHADAFWYAPSPDEPAEQFRRVVVVICETCAVQVELNLEMLVRLGAVQFIPA